MKQSIAGQHGQRLNCPVAAHRARAHPILRRASTQATRADVAPLVQQWLHWDSYAETRTAIQNLFDAERYDELYDLLSSRLEFGTAGLRGKLGPGTNRMNDTVVRQTAQGLCAYLQHQCPQQLMEAGVVLGYDGRHGSRQFALITAAVFMSVGARVALFRKPVPTPFVAAGVVELGAAAGVMVTASHNPKEYNGYKVYWGNGCQIIPPHDAGIAAAIAANLDPWGSVPDESVTLASPLLTDPWDIVTRAYYARLARLHWLPAPSLVLPQAGVDSGVGAGSGAGAGAATGAVGGPHGGSMEDRDRALAALGRPVYTPLHGVGAEAVLRAFQVLGLPEPYIVPEQYHPDPDFPTVVFPNPEEGKGTWNLAFKAGVETGARLVIANDPDADRLCAAERDPSSPIGWRVFSGNEIGALLAHWVWRNIRIRNPEVPASRFVMLASAVSSKLCRSMAEKEGFRFVETLTGFKWLGNTALALEAQGSEVLFAFEEAIGFMLGPMYRDKDGVSAAVVFTELAADTYGKGGTLDGLLRQLYEKYGYFDYRSGYFIADRPEKSRAVFAALRGGSGDGGSGPAAGYATSVAGVPVKHVRDLGTALDTSQADGRAVLPWLPGDMMITYTLSGGATLTLRASGTEPKLKYYLEVVGSDAGAAAALADRLQAAVAEELVGVRRHGLTMPPAST